MAPEDRIRHDRRYCERIFDPGPAVNREKKRSARESAKWLRGLLNDDAKRAVGFATEAVAQPRGKKGNAIKAKPAGGPPRPVSGDLRELGGVFR